MMALGAAGGLLMLSSCKEGGISTNRQGGETETDSVIDGGHGIGIDTATVNLLDSIEDDSNQSD